MRTFVSALAAGAVLGLAAGAAPAAAHSAPPCNDSGEPGHSDYAQHHIRPMAQQGDLGEGGHRPGDHRGYAACSGAHG